MEFEILLILAMDNIFLFAIKSAKTPKPLQEKYIAMYGNDEYRPFWKHNTLFVKL